MFRSSPGFFLLFIGSVNRYLQLPLRNGKQAVNGELHFHNVSETKFLDDITFRRTEGTTGILRLAITVPKFQTIAIAVISIDHFRCVIARHF